MKEKQTVKETVLEETSGETGLAVAEKPEKSVKKKGKPRGGNSPVIGTNGFNLDDGDNSKFMRVQLALFNMAEIDLNDKEQVAERLSEYFCLYAENDMKPTVAGMGLALNGMSRQTVRAIATDSPTGGSGYKSALPPEVAYLIKKAYKIMENLWETYMNSGKVNPVAGIFLGKNNYGYQDKTDLVLTPNTQNENDYDPNDIKQRYLAGRTQQGLTAGNEDEPTE